MTVEALSAPKATDPSKFSVAKAIRQAAGQAGIDFDLMLGVARRESGLRPDAKAATSSASGLFQFIDQTWLGAIKAHGDAIGLGSYAQDITDGEAGYTVEDPARREEILNLRFRPEIAAKVAGRTLAAAKDRLSAALGREATGSEVYLAHFLGERGALRMLKADDTAVAAEVDPRAASANAPLFFDAGRPVSVAEFRQNVAMTLGEETAPPPQTVTPGPYRPRAPVAVDHYANPATQGAGLSPRGLPPQLHAAIIQMQSDFIMGRSDR